MDIKKTQSIIISGASRGIGKYLIDKFTDADGHVFGTYYQTTPNEKYLKYLTKVNICNHVEVHDWIDKIKLNLNKIVLINCASINYNSFAHKSDINKWTNVIETNLIGTFNLIHNVLPIMREQNYGRIINLSSVVAKIGVQGTSAYAASKSALTGLAKSIAVENAEKGITINNLNLGYFNIGMIAEVSPQIQDSIKKRLPTNKFGDPQNIFNAIQFLIATDYVNGSSIELNGSLY
ncbi:MAG: SDR family NAD(P)-dependent oxidoreductase [Ignavibacteriales bacterium]|nr:SDR family NAD(P)-dependent oxidoreductase [Ignavibacteriales bacterium]